MLLELAELAHEGEEVAALHEVHNHVELGGGLEGEAQPHDEGVVHGAQNLALSLGALDLAALPQLVFLKIFIA